MKLPKFLIKATGDIYLTIYPAWVQYKPHHHKVVGKEVRIVLDLIQRADILLRRYDGYLNTIFTPGFWGHGGVYVGNNKVIHAVGKGVIEEDILDFCRADSVVVLRVITIDDNMKHNVINKAYQFLQEKTEYDYEFKDKNKKVYCTEMVNEVYNSLFDEQYEEVAGNLVLTPDGIRYSKKASVIMEVKH